MPIYLASKLKYMTITRITGNDKIKGHLTNLGFIVGESIMLINTVDDNVIVKVKGVSLGISKELAKRVLVA